MCTGVQPKSSPPLSLGPTESQRQSCITQEVSRLVTLYEACGLAGRLWPFAPAWVSAASLFSLHKGFFSSSDAPGVALGILYLIPLISQLLHEVI